jgi:lipopolysaccharide/colanic/teichoic acid biosynthesis glycosyltransferase
MHSGIVEALTAVASDLKDKPDAEQDNIERLAVIGRVLQMFSLEELKSLWQEIKDQDSIVV